MSVARNVSDHLPSENQLAEGEKGTEGGFSDRFLNGQAFTVPLSADSLHPVA